MFSNANKGYEIVLKLSQGELHDESSVPAFFLSKPEIRAVYKQTEAGEITDDVHLKYFKIPSPNAYPIDLNEGFEKFVFRNAISLAAASGKFIKYILETEDNVFPSPSKLSTPSTSKAEIQITPTQASKRKLVLSQRGVLARIMMIPYRLYRSHYNNSEFFVTRYCDILHLVAPDRKDGVAKNNSYHGKFEQICFSDDPDEDPITDVPVDLNKTTFCVYRSSVKEFDLIYSAEIAGILADHKIDDVHNLEEVNSKRLIVTKLLWQSDKDILGHPKCLQWWLQAYLANTNDICVGLKDKDGFIRTPVQLKRAQDLPKNQPWKPVICIRFLHTMLSLIEDTMSRVDCPYTTYEFKYDSFGKCIKSKIHRGKTEYSFLPEDYIKHCKERTNSK